MDFTFTEEQQAAVEAAKAVFSGVAPDGVPSPALTPGAVAEEFDRPLWAKLADADLLSLVLAPEHGGAGLDPIALCLVLRESAKVLARVPLLETSAVAMAVERYGSAELGDEILPRVGRGELVLTVGANGRTGHDPAELAVTARRDDGSGSGVDSGTGAGTEAVAGWVLDGVQTGVPWAQSADRIAVPAHTDEGRAVIALVPRDQEGLALAEQISTSGERFAEVSLESVRIDARELIDTEGAWEWLRQLLATGTCALALGLGEGVLSMTSEYTGKREQFGFPVATFQAVAVQAADRYIDLRAMEATLWQAAWRLAPSHTSAGVGGPLPVSGDVAVAKIWASEGVRRVVQTAQHLHGGFGADTDYPLHRYHAWAKQLELSLGPAAAHEEALGDLLAAHPLG
ncbi:acyl-CoA/acyl-ACP dehydrogenase [Streptomyces lunaelactis]|uniref:acyl-CoA dehydrogenase family protein n=1 Tax=Streptomyces lunaelactis TaxID=1535768 RepID=UPI0015850EAE|nr:acyl-CoA dehydrogenase family protein [Streptomyces lunaelactis]NUK12469.1 acyl-CoA/acyl-ACP dehydrogenase [Streptomyces lunaelactis]NUK38832.1 acyl-CoA/acyl-ACP dehydrogenase [Streptomyces lunaelactis]NUK45605.1 acyl-CoA/acyl-ACP dehydrogenase [Streptomyces lunaelactis]NUK54967.1 acyl-CoA/acyl-ACP dehydrogenase [Streptomyces lunaelactis]NUK68691.1 acyl-CoA/acyl-ACP dehydrogenase [Streptomyces lunaelactis]